jgi:ABC-2 type transport system permease protein
VDLDKTAAAVLIPAGFSASIQNPQSAVAAIEIYANPTRPTGAGLVKTIVEEFASRAETGRVGAQVILAQLGARGLLPPEKAAQLAGSLGASQAQNAESALITVKAVNGESAPKDFNVLAYMAPGMALMFLMYTVSHGGRTLLAERSNGTLPRLLVAPVRPVQVLAGKVFGIFLTGAAQMLILVGASSLFFRLNWGNPLAVLVLVVAAVFGATGWGLLITALARTPGQVSTVGSATMLMFGILGGSFIKLENMPVWIWAFSRITPNAWGLDGFTILAGGGQLGEIGPQVAALLAMGLILFGLAAWVMTRRGSDLV